MLLIWRPIRPWVLLLLIRVLIWLWIRLLVSPPLLSPLTPPPVWISILPTPRLIQLEGPSLLLIMTHMPPAPRLLVPIWRSNLCRHGSGVRARDEHHSPAMPTAHAFYARDEARDRERAGFRVSGRCRRRVVGRVFGSSTEEANGGRHRGRK